MPEFNGREIKTIGYSFMAAFKSAGEALDWAVRFMALFCVLDMGKMKALYICACIHRYMASKTISIRDDVYNLLKGARRDEESFSDVIERLLKKEKIDLSEYFGALKDSPLLDKLEEDSKKIREMARSRI